MKIDFSEFSVVNKIPRKHNGSGYAVAIEDFLRSDHNAVERECGSEISKIYSGLLEASKKPEFSGKVVVVMRGTKVYMIRKGVADA